MNIDWNYINLASRSDRREHTEKEFANHDIPTTRFEGLLPDNWLKHWQMQRMKNRTPGAIGCYKSQMALIYKSHLTKNVVAVCEDDVCFCNDLQKRLEYIGKFLIENEWDIFYLGATFHVPGKWFNNPECKEWNHLGVDVEPTSDPHILRTYGIWSTYAYLVNPETALQTHNLFDTQVYRSDGIDHLAILLGPRLKTYCFVPGCAWQYDNESNIGNGITKFSNFKSLGPYVWTDRMEDFDPSTFNWKTGEYYE